MSAGGYVYIITNEHHTTLYIGVTSTIYGRIEQHKEHFFKKSFSDRYNLIKLVYFERHELIIEANRKRKAIEKTFQEKQGEVDYKI
jgi:putative endonuclease